MFKKVYRGKNHTFAKGIHMYDFKELSKNCSIEKMKSPQMLYIPLNQGIGAVPEIVVKIGDTVKKGQLLAKANSAISANVFSSASGKVVGFEVRQLASSGKGNHIIIENDFSETEQKFADIDFETASKEQIIERVRDCGIVGMGGAGFPTAVKIDLKKSAVCNTVIINGAECEPYITCDFRLMLEQAQNVVKGAKLLARAVGANKIIFAIESNKPEAIEKIKENEGIDVVEMKTKYPQGAEKQLIYATTGQKLGLGKLPIDCGVVVQNVHTALSVFNAVCSGEPCSERLVTVSGGAIKQPKNIWVKTGTLFSEIEEFCGGIKEDIVLKKVLNGGTMMGVSQYNLNVSVTKTTSSILFLGETETDVKMPKPCINCARCSSVCPMNLMPMYIDAFGLVGEIETAEKYGATACIECGCCTYVCPSKRPLVQSIRLSKKMIKAKQSKN